MSDTTPPPTAVALHAALAAGERPPRPSPLSVCLTFGWRGLLKVKHVPEQLVDVTVGPVLMLVSFTYLFGGAIDGSTGDYLQFLLPGMLVQAVLFTAVQSGVALHSDAHRGIADRFRSLPVWRPAPLVGAVLGDAVRYAVAATVILVTGRVMGFDAGGGLAGMVAGALLVVAFAVALSWLLTTLGLVVRSPSAVQGIGMMGVFLLVFFSNVLVDPATLPSALEIVVDANPISHLTSAARGLIAGDPSTRDIAVVLGEAAALTAVFTPLTGRLYTKR